MSLFQTSSGKNPKPFLVRHHLFSLFSWSAHLQVHLSDDPLGAHNEPFTKGYLFPLDSNMLMRRLHLSPLVRPLTTPLTLNDVDHTELGPKNQNSPAWSLLLHNNSPSPSLTYKLPLVLTEEGAPLGLFLDHTEPTSTTSFLLSWWKK